MYKKDFDVLIKSKNIPQTLLLCGNCDYQLHFLENEVLKIWDSEEVLKLYFDEYDFKLAKTHLSQASLFSRKNALLIKSEKIPSKKEIEELLELCKKNDANYLLFVHYGYDKNFANMFGKSFVRVFKTGVNEALGFLNYEAKKIGLQAENDVLQKLLFAHNEDLALSVGELEKLSILNRKITAVDINNLIIGMGEIDLDDFFAKLLKGEKITTFYKTLSENGAISEVAFINALQMYVLNLFLFHAYIKINGVCDTFKILGHPLPPQIEKERIKMSQKFDVRTFNALCKILNDAEYVLKSPDSKIDKESLVIAMLLELQRYLK